MFGNFGKYVFLLFNGNKMIIISGGSKLITIKEDEWCEIIQFREK